MNKFSPIFLFALLFLNTHTTQALTVFGYSTHTVCTLPGFSAELPCSFYADTSCLHVMTFDKESYLKGDIINVSFEGITNQDPLCFGKTAGALGYLGTENGFREGFSAQVLAPYNNSSPDLVQHFYQSVFGHSNWSFGYNQFPYFYSFGPGGAQTEIGVVGTSACSDSLNNDSLQGADSADPQCHSDCNVNNAASYVSSHTSEATPPNGSCPAPILNLSGRSAGSFLHFLANLFTSKAIAQETSEVKATTIASVNIYGGAIKEIGINTLEVGFTLKSDLGTQAGVRYGVVIKKKDSQEVVDTFAGPETLSLKYAEYVYKSLTYTSPVTLNGEHDVYLEVTTDSNIPLATKKLGTYSFIKERDTQTFVKSCTFDMNAFNATCVVGNKDKVSPTDVLLVTDVRKGGALGALIQAQQVTPLTFDPQGLSTTILPMLREPGAYALDVTLVQTQRPLSHTVYEYRITGNGEVVIDNVFVEQADKKTFSVGVVSLSSSQEAQNVVVYLTKNEKVLAESSAALMRPRTDVALTYKGFSTPDAVRVAITKADGTVLAEKTTPYASPFEKKAGITFGWGALIVLAIIVIGYIVSLLRRKV